MALVTSKFDYCNTLLHQIPARDLQKLQRVQNCLARVVTKAPRFNRSIPLIKLLNDGQPSYSPSLLFSADSVKHLRSNNINKLIHVWELSSVLVPFLFPGLLLAHLHVLKTHFYDICSSASRLPDDDHAYFLRLSFGI